MAKIEIIDDKYIYLGSYPQNGTEPEPIRWQIINKENNIYTVMTEKILINFMYDRYYSEYKNSAVRKYINHEFVPSAFTYEELNLIIPTDLGCDVVDKVYVPTVEELSCLTKEERIRKVTPYAHSNNASSYPVTYKSERHLLGNGWYWTRTPYKPPYNPTCDREVWYVEYNGSFNARVTTGHDIGIVMFMRIKIDE